MLHMLDTITAQHAGKHVPGHVKLMDKHSTLNLFVSDLARTRAARNRRQNKSDSVGVAHPEVPAAPSMEDGTQKLSPKEATD
eukprot:683524-Alexandrium_andersonii.AAC.1